MSKLLAQHGPAKGQKITDSLNMNNLSGAIFSQNDEIMESIDNYINMTDNLGNSNSFLDPQFYYSTYDQTILKKLSDISVFPSNIVRRDWRKKAPEILDYLNYHAKSTTLISDTLITPGFHITNIDWHFDYSIEMYNYCIENFEFQNYALSLMVQSSFFNNKANVDEMIEELEDMSNKKDYIYFTLCHDGNIDNNYEEMDSNCLGNILYLIYQLQESGFKFIIGYSFMNSILFAMLGCDFIASGWFNTLRKFQKNRFELTDSFGRRKKRYTSIPLLTYIMLDDYKIMLDTGKITEAEILSGTKCDSELLTDDDVLSFVDLEHQYWESLNQSFGFFESSDDITGRIDVMRAMINEALAKYKKVINRLDSMGEREASNRIKLTSKHLITWLAAIDIFKENSMIL